MKHALAYTEGCKSIISSMWIPILSHHPIADVPCPYSLHLVTSSNMRKINEYKWLYLIGGVDFDLLLQQCKCV